MSAILFLGAKKALNKTEFEANEVFSDIKYPDSLFFRDGIVSTTTFSRETGSISGTFFQNASGTKSKPTSCCSPSRAKKLLPIKIRSRRGTIIGAKKCSAVKKISARKRFGAKKGSA